MATYPNEVFPADATIESLDGTTDLATGLPYVAKGVGPNSLPTYEVQYNRRQLRQNGIVAAMRAGMVVDEGSLNIGVYPINYTLGGVRKSFDGATNQAVPDDAVRKVYIDSANALQLQTAYPADLTAILPLASVTAASGSLTIADDRQFTLFEVSPVGITAMTLPLAPTVFLAGTLSTGVAAIEWTAPFDLELRNAMGRVNTAPVGADLIVDIRVDGTTIFASQAEMIVIADGAQQDTSATKNHAVFAGEVLTFEVEQIGSTAAGADLTIVLNAAAGLV